MRSNCWNHHASMLWCNGYNLQSRCHKNLTLACLYLPNFLSRLIHNMTFELFLYLNEYDFNGYSEWSFVNFCSLLEKTLSWRRPAKKCVTLRLTLLSLRQKSRLEIASTARNGGNLKLLPTAWRNCHDPWPRLPLAPDSHDEIRQTGQWQ